MNVKKFKNSIFLLIFTSLNFLLAHTSKATLDGNFSLITSNGGNLVQGCKYTLDIRVNTGTNVSNAADIIVLFDPTKIQVVDSDTVSPGVQIKPGVAYESYFGNQVDNFAGTIRLTGGSFTNYLSGDGLFGTIEFKSLPSITSAAFTIKFDGAADTNTLDSNIAIASTGLDALGSVNNINLNFNSGVCADDTVAPNVNFISPYNNQTNVPLDQNIRINLTDNLSGIDLNSLVILVNGVPYDVNSPELVFTGDPLNYQITLNPNENFYSDAPSNIVVKVKDYSGNERQSNISFNYPIIITPTPPITISPTPSPTLPPTTTPTQITTPTPTLIISPTPTTPPLTQSPPTPTSSVTSTPTPIPTINLTPNVSPPDIQFITPVSQQTIPDSSTIVIKVYDPDGININSLQILVNEQRYTVNDSTVRIEGGPNEYTIRITDKFNFPDLSSSYVSVYVADIFGNSSINSIRFNIPALEASQIKKDEICAEVKDNADRTPISSAPFGNNVLSIQDKIEGFLPQGVKPFFRETGLLGILSLLASLPLLVWLLSVLLSFLAGGVLFPFLWGLFGFARKNYGYVLNEDKEGIKLVKILIYNAVNQKLLKKTISTFNGKYFLKLKSGSYRIEFNKNGYKNKSLTISLEEESYITEIITLEEYDILSSSVATQFQFKTFKLDPKVISVYFALVLAFLNLFYMRTFTSLVVLGFLILCAIFLSRKSKKKITNIS